MLKNQPGTFLLDTSAFSDLMLDESRVRDHMESLPSTQRVIICPIVRGEILHGVARLPKGKRRSQLEGKAASLFSIIPCEPLPEAAGDHYATVKLSRQRQGLSMGENDLWIAAMALALGAVLVTQDSDFHGIEGLDIEDWTAQDE